MKMIKIKDTYLKHDAFAKLSGVDIFIKDLPKKIPRYHKLQEYEFKKP